MVFTLAALQSKQHGKRLRRYAVYAAGAKQQRRESICSFCQVWSLLPKFPLHLHLANDLQFVTQEFVTAVCEGPVVSC